MIFCKCHVAYWRKRDAHCHSNIVFLSARRLHAFLSVEVRNHFIAVTERSCGEMHTTPLLFWGLCVHPSQAFAGAEGISSQNSHSSGHRKPVVYLNTTDPIQVWSKQLRVENLHLIFVPSSFVRVGATVRNSLLKSNILPCTFSSCLTKLIWCSFIFIYFNTTYLRRIKQHLPLRQLPAIITHYNKMWWC